MLNIIRIPLLRLCFTILLSLATLIGCQKSQDMHTVQQPAEPTRLAALMTGKLNIVEDCVRLNNHSLVWHHDIQAEVLDNKLHVTENGFSINLNANDEVNVSGGVVVSHANLDSYVKTQVEGRCTGPFWLVSEISLNENLD